MLNINFSEHTLLVVDDNVTNLNVITTYLDSLGFKVFVATDGATAIKRAKFTVPSLILLDVMMPGMDGFETCRQLQTIPETKQIPVIFMTALSEVEDKLRGFEVGAVDYITKPFRQEEVLARVVSHLHIYDLTRQLSQKNEALQQANQELTALNERKDKFFSIVAHDLRSPFMPLLSGTELMMNMASKLSAEEVAQLAKIVHNAAKNTFGLLDNLLDWARLQMGRMEYEPRNLDLFKVAYRTVSLLTYNASAKQIDLHNKIQPQSWVYADENVLDTVIRNLINNALKFTSAGGEVTISATPFEAEFMLVSVADTGVGISAEAQMKLFKLDQHVTTMGTNKETGTGLGLIICQEMVVKSGGRIWVESELGRGTTVHFTVRLTGQPQFI